MCKKFIHLTLFFTLVLGLAQGQARGSYLAAWWDGDYPTGWADEASTVAVRDALEVAGYEILDSAQLKTWMDARIADGVSSVVVFCRDIAPDTVVETNTADCTLRKYLDAGGRIVFYADIPFYNQGHSGGGMTNWGDGGAIGILGFNAAGGGWDSGNTVTITEEGAEWGLTETWGSVRAAAPDDVDIILATDNAGNAAAWVKHYAPGDTSTGFVRIRDVGGMPNVDDIMRVAEYGLGGNPYARGPDPKDGAMLAATWYFLEWKPGDFAVSHDVYLGDNFDDVNDGTADTFRGNQTATDLFIGFIGNPYPDGLVPGTTYYWRIDEVNDTDPNSPWKGKVWSFWVQPRIAYEPTPADGAKFIDPNADLSWTAGLGAMVHYVYFGDNFDDVNSAVGDLFQADTTYALDTLEPEKTYYWRVDEFDSATTHKGDVWSFKTLPDIPITDPNLVGWWKLDEGTGTTVVDWSGHGNHGTINGDPQSVAGYDGDALEFDGRDDYVSVPLDVSETEYAAALWFKTTNVNCGLMAVVDSDLGGGGHDRHIYLTGGNIHIRLWDTEEIETAGLNLANGLWHHVAYTYGATIGGQKVYVDGVLRASGTKNASDFDWQRHVNIGFSNDAANNYFEGVLDDVRIYNKALTQEEVMETMRGDPLLAGVPNPTNGSTPYIREATPLSWSPGENASQHDVYFGIDKDAVADANASDTTGIYRGRQFGTSYTPPDVEWGGGPYYWRIDEYNTDSTISTGRIWNFTVADFIGIEDFEDYNDFEPDRIFDVWLDGWGVDTNGSEVGYADPNFPAGEHHVETTIVHGGEQSMPYFYDNNFKYSEATYSPTQRDWTEEGVGVLSLWFRGIPDFLEGPAGTYTMSGAGTDIWGTADEFRYAYKQLSGDGEIVAQVLSVQNTNGWAKAGVMIRETLDPGSKHAFVCITPSNGKSFQNRKQTDQGSSNSNTGGFTAPYWVKLVRQGNQFTAYHSEDGVNWVLQAANTETANPETVSMATNVFIGLAVTSHNSGVTCVAEFSDVETTGAVTPPAWTHEAIGVTMAANDPALMYVALNGGTAVYHDNANAALIGTWTEWTIDLQAFETNLFNVSSIEIGFGDMNNLQAGGTGLVLFDDIRLYRPAP